LRTKTPSPSPSAIRHSRTFGHRSSAASATARFARDVMRISLWLLLTM